MRKIGLLMAVMVLLSVVAASAEEVRIYTWSEYMDEEKMPTDFEARTGIKVRLDIYENNEEMVAKLQAGGVSQYDIIVPSDYIMPVLINQNLVQPLDHGQIPNLGNLKPIFRNTTYDPGNKYSVAYQWGTVGLMYRKDKVSADAVKSWSVLFDAAKQPGAFWLIDSVREMMGIALVYQGKDFNSTNPVDLKAAADLLVATKRTKNCMGFKPGVGGKNDVVAGTAVAAIVYNGDAIQSVSQEPDKLGFVIPKEGSEIWYDSMCIPAKAPNPAAAHKWINWILDPQVGAELSNYNQYATPNAAAEAHITPEDLENSGIYPTPEIMEKLYFTKDLGKQNRIMDEAWTRAKSH
ncbi:spermidine/putrescine ABC transporter substrate-binding protein [Desulfosarcina ovata]|uniref:Putrescine-binding periplasmic protein n=1 Tax=Desulfosarcina ovata subsp. ovata TaxID=2752305 RepID=A0A5K8AGB0_9BACT|nr:spermidine/putrescine ABC transporter substrate-binding protein [Desulfosarcina ovata]BBO91516.1 putrescine-binding periplasmic protein [Desulfosarcina ovata subsp. ovata]